MSGSCLSSSPSSFKVLNNTAKSIPLKIPQRSIFWSFSRTEGMHWENDCSSCYDAYSFSRRCEYHVFALTSERRRCLKVQSSVYWVGWRKDASSGVAQVRRLNRPLNKLTLSLRWKNKELISQLLRTIKCAVNNGTLMWFGSFTLMCHCLDGA